MLLLAIETSTLASSVALGDGTDVIAQQTHARARGHVEFLMPAILEMFAATGSTIRECAGVAVCVGPGLFTGMRVGIATAKTVAQVLGVRVACVTSLDLVAHAAGADTVCACIDAKRGHVFAALYRSGAPVGSAESVEPGVLAQRLMAMNEPVVFAGDGARAYREVFDLVPGATFAGEECDPSAPSLLALAAPLFAAGDTMEPARVEPLYLRSSDAEIAWGERGVSILRPSRVQVPKRARGGVA